MSRKRDELVLPVQASWNSSLTLGGLILRSSGREVRIGGINDDTAEAIIGSLTEP